MDKKGKSIVKGIFCLCFWSWLFWLPGFFGLLVSPASASWRLGFSASELSVFLASPASSLLGFIPGFSADTIILGL